MLRWILIGSAVFLLVIGLSTLAAWAWGRFARAARGAPSVALAREAPDAPRATELDRLIDPLTRAHPEESGLVLLEQNVGALAARVASARAAGRSLDILYYIWADGLTGALMMKELSDAADRGVRVRLLVDDIGVGRNKDRPLAALDSHPMVEVRLFNPTRQRAAGLRRGLEMALRLFSVTRRMHNKVWIADGRLAISGGRNIADAYFDADEQSNFRDLDLLTLGPVTDQLEAMFDEYWNSAAALPVRNLGGQAPDRAEIGQSRARLDARLNSAQMRNYLAHAPAQPALADLLGDGICWDRTARLVADPAAKAMSRQPENWIMAQITPVMAAAARQVQITSPYFVPGTQGTAAILEMVARGIDVSILTNSLAANDVAAVHGGYANYRRALLAGGAKLYELRRTGPRQRLSFRGAPASGASLHTKAFSVDDHTGFIGSVNFDPRSASLNTEMGILFQCPDLIARMHRLFADEIAPEASYRPALDARGRLVWHDEITTHRREPDASLWRRAFAFLVGRLPLESQL